MTAGKTPVDGSEETGRKEPPGWKVEGLDYPTFRLVLIGKVMDRLTNRQFTGNGDLTYAEWRVLARLSDSPGGLTVTQAADQAWADRAEVSRAARSLEEKGFARREESPTDRRKTAISLTDKGREQFAKTAAERAAFHERLLVDLSREERAQLDSLLRRVADRLMEDAPNLSMS